MSKSDILDDFFVFICVVIILPSFIYIYKFYNSINEVVLLLFIEN